MNRLRIIAAAAAALTFIAAGCADETPTTGPVASTGSSTIELALSNDAGFATQVRFIATDETSGQTVADEVIRLETMDAHTVQLAVNPGQFWIDLEIRNDDGDLISYEDGMLTIEIDDFVRIDIDLMFLDRDGDDNASDQPEEEEADDDDDDNNIIEELLENVRDILDFGGDDDAEGDDNATDDDNGLERLFDDVRDILDANEEGQEGEGDENIVADLINELERLLGGDDMDQDDKNLVEDLVDELREFFGDDGDDDEADGNDNIVERLVDNVFSNGNTSDNIVENVVDNVFNNDANDDHIVEELLTDVFENDEDGDNVVQDVVDTLVGDDEEDNDNVVEELVDDLVGDGDDDDDDNFVEELIENLFGDDDDEADGDDNGGLHLDINIDFGGGGDDADDDDAEGDDAGE